MLTLIGPTLDDRLALNRLDGNLSHRRTLQTDAALFVSNID